MRTLIISALCSFSLALSFSSPVAAQSNSAKDQLPESLSQKLSFSSALPLLQPQPQSGSATAGDENPSSSANALLKDKAFTQLRQQLATHPFGISSACAHIIIYVPPVTDTKMIIKVPGSDKLPESRGNDRAVPNMPNVAGVGACGEDLRRVDAPHPAPPSTPDGKAKLVPVQQAPIPH